MATPKRAGSAKTPDKAAKAVAETPKPPPDLVVRGLTRADFDALERETERRQAALPTGAKLSRNAVAVALFREALAAAEARAESST